MRHVLILGLGNDLLSDDAVGLRVVNEIRGRLAADSRIDVHETTEMGLALLDLIVGYDALVVVDSIQTGRQAPGFIHELEALHLLRGATRTPHAVGIEQLCHLGSMRGLSVPRHVKIIAVEVGDPFTFGNEMTAEVAAAIDDAADLAVQRALEFTQLHESTPTG